ncbi:sensor histidine kinase [Companilactobacillus alimentarius]|uniref:HAMP domain-containing protein n=1 Tax=Companilactobacillus alimentarius DSM 20249 TaxID=1423720 RepID=A0A2K9HN91_9LACO|nr:sensor histidine kinase [Companilactobacillus alimentarius]AUI71633.1 hypothetical protein LA20249_05315 [Companilactobacillus alimentarius DSM 20249]KRK78357.1 histidine protein kinase [Companilactobacillus alimentarius DSM 20249]GEO44630.1 two-component sensor histidine kinase [Companilactobacillus alimentarius]
MLRNRYNLQKLMTFYIKVMVTTITLFAVIMAIFKIHDIFGSMNQTLMSGVNRTSLVINVEQAEANQFAKNIIQTPSKVKNLQNFFQLNSADYLTYSQNHSNEEDFYFLPNQAADFMQNNNSNRIAFTLNQESQGIILTPDNPGGVRVDAKKLTSEGLYYGVPLINDATFQSFGSVIVNFPIKNLDDNLSYSPNKSDLQVFVMSNLGRIRYSFNSQLSGYANKVLTQNPNQEDILLNVLKKKYFLKKQVAGNGDLIIGLVPKVIIYRRIAFNLLIFLVGAIVIDGFLWWSLKYIFHNYRIHLKAMTDSLDAISNGNLKTRVPVPTQEGELNTLATGINDMLDAIDQYVLQIYQLQLEQKDANMKALQSQINPHFLYNTLEYIRMYAINEGQKELADVVFSFANLLRNNISQESTVTLDKEFEFAEKYIYLYQMRFPDQIGYQLNLDEKLKKMKVPKFIIQPLIENYFGHGIDLERFDNAVHIRADKLKNMVEISIADNGTPLTEEQLKDLNDKLASQEVKSINGNRSIGLMNVKARMMGAFGHDFKMFITNNRFNGVTVKMQIFLEE